MLQVRGKDEPQSSRASSSDARLAGEPVRPSSRGSRSIKYLSLAGKLVVTILCFWYVLRRLNAADTFHALAGFNYLWVAFAVAVATAQLPLLALRLQIIVRALAPQPAGLTFLAANALTAIYWLFAQILPSLAGEGVRAWMLTRLGYNWRTALTSIIIDRGAGVIALCAFAFAILLLPSALTALAGYRDLVALMFAILLVSGGLSLLLVPRFAPLLQRWRYSRWIGLLAADAHRVLLGPQSVKIFSVSCLIHLLTIVAVWSVSRAEGLAMSAPDCAVLFVVMVGVLLVPISIGGWGLREFAVVSLLAAHGVSSERAFLFSLCFGFVFMASALPGALIYPLYPLRTRLAVASTARADL